MTHNSDVQILDCSRKQMQCFKLQRLSNQMYWIGPERPLVDGVADILEEQGFVSWDHIDWRKHQRSFPNSS